MKKKRLTVATLLGAMLLILSGCVRTDKHGHPIGWVYNYMAKPMQHLMTWLAQHMGNNYGWAIVVIVVIVRLILLPVMMSQMKKSTLMQEKMAMVQPQLRELQQRQKDAKTPQEQAAVSQQMMQLYRDNNISMTGGIGCLPLLIQLPIFAALYAAIRYSPDLYHATFMGMPLGKPNAILAILAFLAYMVQGWLSMIGVPKEQRKQMGAAMLMSPVMILFIAWSSSAGLGLYFVVSALFAILQTWLVNAWRPKLRENIKQEMKDHPVKMPDPIPAQPATTKPTTDTIEQLKKSPVKNKPAANKNRRRNAGKQHHHSSK